MRDLSVSANSAKNPTSSSSGPTATTSAPPATKTVIINDDEEAIVGADTDERYYMGDPDPAYDAVIKCPAATCNVGTIHQGIVISRHPTGAHTCAVEDHPHPPIVTEKRVYMCTNCGRFSLK